MNNIPPFHYFRDTSDEMDYDILYYSVGYNKLIVPVDKKRKGCGQNYIDVEHIIDINEVMGTHFVKFTLWRTFLNSRLTNRYLKDDVSKN